MRSSIHSILTGKTGEIYCQILKKIRFTTPSTFISSLWNAYQKTSDISPSISGRIFEYAVAEILFQSNITPFYYQAKLTFVPNAKFDFVLYTPSKPIVLSTKTSLRERYKQADLEGSAMKAVYRKAVSVLITLDAPETKRIIEKMITGEITGLDKCLVANSSEFDDFIDELSGQSFVKGEKITPIEGQLCINR